MRRIVWLLVLLALALGPGRLRGQDDEPEVPHDPPGVASAQLGLNHDWRLCRVEAYPVDVQAGSEKFSSTVRFERAGRKLRGVLAIGFHKLDGTPLAPTRAQVAFVQCVRTRFEARRFYPGSGDEVARQLGSWGLVNPAYDGAVVEDGQLGARAATAYVLHQLVQHRFTCNVKPGTRVVVDVAADGSPAAVNVTAASPPTAACLRSRLRERLRFPATGKPSQVTAVGGA